MRIPLGAGFKAQLDFLWRQKSLARKYETRSLKTWTLAPELSFIPSYDILSL